MNNYHTHTKDLRSELKDTVDTNILRELHKKKWWKHFAILLKQIGALLLCCWAIFVYDSAMVWVPCSIVIGFITFAWNPMLHEVIHNCVFQKKHPILENILGYFYANMGGLCKTQFTRWHLKHHSELGSFEEDPKRAYLTPKIITRWYKFLYLTPALFLIYFKAASRETQTYPRSVQQRIFCEKIFLFSFHLLIFLAITLNINLDYALKTHIIPYVFIFPIAFTINRLGQHYAIDPDDPAHWTTLIQSNLITNNIFAYSNLHLEHHYFPRVPCYNLPKLQSCLYPLYQKHGIKSKKYSWLLYQWFILNQEPHTNWNNNQPVKNHHFTHKKQLKNAKI